MTNTVASGASSTRGEKRERHGDENPAHDGVQPGVLPGAGGVVGEGAGREDGHQRAARTWSRRPQACSRLMVSSITNEITSITSPSAAAPP